MAHSDYRTRVGQLRLLNANWSRFMDCWLREREVRGRGALVVFVDRPDFYGRGVPFQFMPYTRLPDLVPHYSGSEVEQMVRRSAPGCPIPLLFLHSANGCLKVDRCEIRLRGAED